MGKSLRAARPAEARFTIIAGEESQDVALNVPGRHNASNALAAIAAARALGVSLADAASALERFEGLKRRLETVGAAAGVTVIDDFAHNPDKIDATLATLRAQPGRLLIMFQPHGYGPLAKMGEELAQSFAGGLAPDDRLYLPDPVYQGGTVERTRGSDWLAEQVRDARRTGRAYRGARGDRRSAAGRSRDGDRIVIMGARDDSPQRIRGRTGRAAQRSGTDRRASASGRHGKTRNRNRLAASRKTTAKGCSKQFPPRFENDGRASRHLEDGSGRRTRCRPRWRREIVGRTDDEQRRRGDGRRHRRNHRPARRLDLSHHLVARRRPPGPRKQRRAAGTRLAGRSTTRSRSGLEPGRF